MAKILTKDLDLLLANNLLPYKLLTGWEQDKKGLVKKQIASASIYKNIFFFSLALMTVFLGTIIFVKFKNGENILSIFALLPVLATMIFALTGYILWTRHCSSFCSDLYILSQFISPLHSFFENKEDVAKIINEVMVNYAKAHLEAEKIEREASNVSEHLISTTATKKSRFVLCWNICDKFYLLSPPVKRDGYKYFYRQAESQMKPESRKH